eukprot:TRINITY_DN421_c1_g1_i1.p1 TRINITY_DN421_c1_g1~~TRINITY_DN421_c1_g1_i1.p1  ORF type:complete len:225 (-),score=90.55 TRINITY_DN421_c1_g1_i1:641-1315(-)
MDTVEELRAKNKKKEAGQAQTKEAEEAKKKAKQQRNRRFMIEADRTMMILLNLIHEGGIENLSPVISIQVIVLFEKLLRIPAQQRVGELLEMVLSAARGEKVHQTTETAQQSMEVQSAENEAKQLEGRDSTNEEGPSSEEEKLKEMAVEEGNADDCGDELLDNPETRTEEEKKSEASADVTTQVMAESRLAYPCLMPALLVLGGKFHLQLDENTRALELFLEAV